MNEILARARALAVDLAHNFLRASTYRLAWSLPVPVLLLLMIMLFLALSWFG